ncbi:tRNA nucleotidyltransferase [Pseudothauera rhizosphaerae]|uniref:tRNA nucleotidyltransferase n=1 Tax=Pseudothauera rhizosphaerae TaxID=2565932 RepID=A0A4S4ADR0_9RHOO|nr:tRNA nucleotidyltransferase [Pseudothauera rhizosphaerae]THF56912.1 tRNA nucleotidyltransferase [Pseudothauera rhizosphaerae]
MPPDSSDPLRPFRRTLHAGPEFSILRLAALAACEDGELDPETLDLMAQQVESGSLAHVWPPLLWPELQVGLMGTAPSRMFRVLRRCGALRLLLPELDALWGVPQRGHDTHQIDVGDHQMRVLDEAARCGAPVEVRFAALGYSFGKSDSPPEHLPDHYRHIERAIPRIDAVCARLGVPESCRDLAQLAVLELERVHRAAEMRAGSISALLERVAAFDQPNRFRNLLTLCACDFHAYPGKSVLPYPKTALMERALAATQAAVPDDGQSLAEARALAVARALRSLRWDEAD